MLRWHGVKIDEVNVQNRFNQIDSDSRETAKSLQQPDYQQTNGIEYG